MSPEIPLGVATTVKIDILKGWLSNNTRGLFYSRVLTAIVVSLAFVLLLFNLGSAIMDWSFLSMGLRGATICFPLLFAVFFGKYNLSRNGALSILVAPTCVIIAGIAQFDLLPPLYIGLGVSAALLTVGIKKRS